MRGKSGTIIEIVNAKTKIARKTISATKIARMTAITKTNAIGIGIVKETEKEVTADQSMTTRAARHTTIATAKVEAKGRNDNAKKD